MSGQRQVPKDTKQLLTMMQDCGWTITRRRNHFKATKPGCRTVTVAVTPSCPRGVLNTWKNVRHAEGLKGL